MKNNIFEFKINQDQKLKIARKYNKSISLSDQKDIEILIDEVETKVINYLSEIFSKLDVYSQPISLDYTNFLEELKKCKFKK